MQTTIEMDEYHLIAEVDMDGNIMVIGGSIDDGDGIVRDLTEAECEAAERKHECLIEEIVMRELRQADADNRADDAIENYINSRGYAA